MKKIISLIVILFLVSSVYAFNASETSTSTSYTPHFPRSEGGNSDINQTSTSTTSAFPSDLKGIYSFFVSMNPYLLIILGVVLVLVSKLARFVGIILIIFALIHILFMFLK